MLLANHKITINFINKKEHTSYFLRLIAYFFGFQFLNIYFKQMVG